MFWCRFGGVLGGGGESIEDNEGVDAAEEVGVDGSDMLLHAVEDDIRGRFWYFSSRTEMQRTRWGYVKKLHSLLLRQIFHPSCDGLSGDTP